MDRMGASRPSPSTHTDSVRAAIEALSVSTELVEEELKPYLDTVLTVAIERKKGIAEQVADSGILPVLAQILRRKSTLTTPTVRLVAELARDRLCHFCRFCLPSAPVKEQCFDTGIVSALVTLLLNQDQDLLLHVSQAIARICYDSNLQQERFLRLGAVPRLASVLLQHSGNEALRSSCLLALCNLSNMGEEDGSMLAWDEGAHFSEGERVFRGTSRYSFGFSSAVTVVRLKQTNGQYSVTVEVLQRCSTLLWGASNRRQAGHRLPNLTHLGSCPKLYKVIKCSVKNIPRNRSLRATVFHTLL
ncbi:rap1 GTPase-GDP dissociation stimulator 1 isoform X1 [Triplophysa rosa]|uniref:Rap1 GTPase-GDP dissociation stimulator 1-like n=1 Tax=Triplophysa rosa TaxID=992332 RepID=A0A9W7THM2_TRIRA|nr:rap1 GTPase-GDP dissociation stimulator 1 isoform X1 [Triplophysa rosa]KAI7796581.1 putative rap1 GTPase-GDP dissociation stimulator 1-like [Triplophysa rosa]